MDVHAYQIVDLAASIYAMQDETLKNLYGDHEHQNYVIQEYVDWPNRHIHNIQ